MATSGQTLNDRINAARYALAGQGLARCVCKATTEEVIGPKKKHLDYLVACTHEPNVSIPQLANLLIERTNHIYWVVVFKALVTVHHLMSYGNERFIQYIASSNYSFELSTFLDKTAARDFSMSTFIRRYSRYINEKALSYRLLAFDFCKVKRGNEGVLRTMPIDRLLKTLPILQNQLDALLEFDCSASDLNNGVINACFMLLFRDLIGLFACHNDGIINLLNKYFTLNKKMCREAFDLYKKFLVRMDKVSDFLRVAEVVGIDKDEIPDLRRAPSSLIDTLEQHLQNLESNKKVLKSSSSNNKSGDLTLIGNLTPPSSTIARPSSPISSSTAGGSSSKSSTNNQTATLDELPLVGLRDDEVRRALEEEARVLSQYGSTDGSKSRPTSSQVKTSSTTSRDNNSPKFAVNTTPISIDDIFGDTDSFATGNNNNNGKSNNKNGLTQTDIDSADLGNLSNTSSSSNIAKQNRPDLDSIKTAIESATTTLEKANNTKATESKRSGMRASDDLFSLIDTSPTPTTATVSSSSNTTTILDSNIAPNPMSPFASSPFVLKTNGHSQVSMGLKPGNPFPEVSSAFPVGFSATNKPTATSSMTNQIFKSSSQSTGANYTNLGGLEGFGDVLQPISAPGKASNAMQSSGGSSGKSPFTSSAGLSSTSLFKGDLDSTLANLAQNLTFEGINKTKK